MIVNVTAAHIAAGKPDDGCNCAVALAVAEAVGCPGNPEWSVDVSNKWIYIDSKRYETPQSVKDFISRYDSGLSVTPFQFEVPHDEGRDHEGTDRAEADGGAECL